MRKFMLLAVVGWKKGKLKSGITNSDHAIQKTD